MLIGLRMAIEIENLGLSCYPASDDDYGYSTRGIFPRALALFETAVISTLYYVQKYLEKRQALTTKEQMDEEHCLIHMISDVHSELDMIQIVLDQQKQILDSFLANSQGSRKSDIETTGTYGGNNRPWAGEYPPEDLEVYWRFVDSARIKLDTYIAHITKIHKDADRVEKTIESFLNLQRTYATIGDTKHGLLIGLASLTLAIMTVVFTPLSFTISLFALPMEQLEQNQKPR